MARGKKEIPALEMTKQFDTNYHYRSPENTSDVNLQANFGSFLETVKLAREQLGERAVPIVLGPITLLRLSRLETDFDEILAKLLPLYSSLLTELQGLGVAEVQLHEPALVMSEASNLREHFQKAYAQLASAELPINLVTHFDDLGETYIYLSKTHALQTWDVAWLALAQAI